MGEMTAAGDGVLVGRVGRERMLLVRSPGGAFTQVAVPKEGPGALLGASEEIYLEGRTPLIAPLDEGGHAGALLVPVNKNAEANESRVLHWNGEAWSEEPIEVPHARRRKRRRASGCSRSPTARPRTPGCSRSCPGPDPNWRSSTATKAVGRRSRRRR